MACRGRPLDVQTIRRLKALVQATSIRHATRAVQVSRNTTRKYTRPAK